MSKKFVRKTFVFILPVFLIAAALAVYQYKVKSSSKVEIEASQLTSVEKGDLAHSVVAVGKIEPISKVEVKSKANGIIKELKVNVGDVVNEGQVLAELDKDNLLAQLREAQAALLAAQSSLSAFEAEYEKNRVEAENPDVVFTRRNFDRNAKLLKDGLIPQQNYDDAQKALEMAENRQNVARSQLSVSKARVAQANAAVAQAQASVDRANDELNNATVRSPIKAVVLSRDVEIGSPVSSILNLGSAATLIMVLGDISKVYVRGKVDESDIGLVKLAQTARIKVETFKDKKFDGSVTEISPMGVEKDNVVSFEVKVSINNPGGELRANMTANAEIILEEHKDTLIVPESTILYDQQRNASVEIPASDLPTGRKKIPVKVGFSNGSRTEITEGLKAGDKVINQ